MKIPKHVARILALSFILILSIAGPAKAYDPDYLNEVVGRGAVSFGDGSELIMYLLQVEEDYVEFETQMDFLEKNGLIQKSMLNNTAGEPLRRGELAYMLCRALNLKGGLKARMLGLHKRFAMEELIYRGVMRQGHNLDLVTGQELVVVVTRAAQLLLDRG